MHFILRGSFFKTFLLVIVFLKHIHIHSTVNSWQHTDFDTDTSLLHYIGYCTELKCKLDMMLQTFTWGYFL